MENNESVDFLAEIGIGQDNGGSPEGGQQQQEETAIDNPTFFGEDFTDWGKVKTEIPQRLSRLKDLEQEVTTLKSSPLTYSDPEVGEYDAFVKNTGKKDWGMFQKMKSTDGLSGVDALVFKTIYDNPELTGREDQIRSKIVSEYKIDPDMFDAESVDFVMNTKKMEADAAAATNWFTELKGKTKVETQSPEQQEQKRSEKLGQWKTAVEESVNQVKKIPIPIWDEATKSVQLLGEYEISDEHRSVFIDPLSKAFAGFDITEQNRQSVGSEFTDRFIARNLPQIIGHAVKVREAQIRSDIEAEYGGGVNRPKPPGSATGNGASELEDYLNS
jgi:hypothetical protein